MHAVIGEGYLGGVEGVGFQNVGAGIQVGFFNAANHVRASQYQQVVVAFDIAWPVSEAFATVILLFELVALDHRAHTAIENQDALFEGVLESLKANAAIGHLDYSVRP
ncbi:hypothetical protein D3C76_874930 [compost metagenome]